MPIKREIWECDYCGRIFPNEERVIEHEKFCECNVHSITTGWGYMGLPPEKSKRNKLRNKQFRKNYEQIK